MKTYPTTPSRRSVAPRRLRWLLLALAAGNSSAVVNAANPPAAPTGPAPQFVFTLPAGLPAARVTREIKHAKTNTLDLLQGQLAAVPVAETQVQARALGPVLERYLPQFGLRRDEVFLDRITKDESGATVARYSQRKNGLPVIGSRLQVSVDSAGTVTGIQALAKSIRVIPPQPRITAAAAREKALGVGANVKSVGEPRLVYVISTRNQSEHLAYEVRVSGMGKKAPFEDLVYVDGFEGNVVDRHALVHPAKLAVHDAQQDPDFDKLPGKPARNDGTLAPDAAVNANYDCLAAVHAFYRTKFQWNSYDGQGAAVVSSIHFAVKYPNAFWHGPRKQMVFGDGDATLANLYDSIDVAAHELTHAVIAATSGLIYANESGALNESLCDIMGTACKIHAAGGRIAGASWLFGENSYTPGTPGDALRYLDDPARDGVSVDYYPDRKVLKPGEWPWEDNDYGYVHANSGIANLAFKLLVTGGTHPRKKTTVNVPALGLELAAKIFYETNRSRLGPGATFRDARAQTILVATGIDPTAAPAAAAAWDAVGVK